MEEAAIDGAVEEEAVSDCEDLDPHSPWRVLQVLAPWWRRDYWRWRLSYSLILFAHNRWQRR